MGTDRLMDDIFYLILLLDGKAGPFVAVIFLSKAPH